MLPAITWIIAGWFLWRWIARKGTSGTDARRAREEFLTGFAGTFAKIAKADGRVSAAEIARVERIFADSGIRGERLRFCVGVFRRAKDDGYDAAWYARNFAAHANADVRSLLYDLLWELAAVDGTISPAEEALLRRLAEPLRLREAAYWRNRRRYARLFGGGGASSGGGGASSGGETGGLARAYRILGCSPSDPDGALKRAYRDQAKKFHPDRLRAQGVPEELVARANARMAEINGAWAEIKSARGL